jgi:hypothetical protein
MKAASPQDAIALLDADHRCAKALFGEFAQLSQQKAGGGKRRALAEKVCMELSIHMRLEEEIFYPPVREATGDDDLLDEADAEHAGAKELIGQILAMKPGDALYDAKVTVLGDYFAHHVKQEREEMFPKARKSGLDLAALGEKLRERKLELLAVPEALREDALVSVSA